MRPPRLLTGSADAPLVNRYQRPNWRSERGESSEPLLLLWIVAIIATSVAWQLVPQEATGWRVTIMVIGALLALPLASWLVVGAGLLAWAGLNGLCFVLLRLLTRCRPSWRERIDAYRSHASPVGSLVLFLARVPAREFTRVGADSYRAHQHLVHVEQVSGLRLDDFGAAHAGWSYETLRRSLKSVPSRPVRWWRAPLLDPARPIVSGPFAALALALLAETINDPSTGAPGYYYRNLRATEWIAEGRSLGVPDRDIAGWVHASGHLIADGVIEPDAPLAAVLARWDGVRDGWAHALAGITPDEARANQVSSSDLAVLAALRGHPPLPL